MDDSDADACQYLKLRHKNLERHIWISHCIRLCLFVFIFIIFQSKGENDVRRERFVS